MNGANVDEGYEEKIGALVKQWEDKPCPHCGSPNFTLKRIVHYRAERNYYEFSDGTLHGEEPELIAFYAGNSLRCNTCNKVVAKIDK